MSLVSVIIPVYNAAAYVDDAVKSVLNQTYTEFECLIINDGSTDHSLAVCQQITDSRIRIINQCNRGLAGARNTGIRYARGRYLAFLDADDLWESDKLERHVSHLNENPEIGISYSQSYLMDDGAKPLGLVQKPKLTNVEAVDILCRNPIGNGSSPVLRREVFEDIKYKSLSKNINYEFYFDETFRQSEDIECWIRIAGTTQWRFEGIGLPLTGYRINTAGLSANLEAQYANWSRAIDKARTYAPTLIAMWGDLARAYQFRYLARRAIRSRDEKGANRFIHAAIRNDFRILLKEPRRTVSTLACAWLMNILPGNVYQRLESRFIGVVRSITRAFP
ncbi:MAG: glycosyltransferase family 2 protein [Candidatus Thiodiazotropha sp. (ex Epidulcina cf. delphinae)]|nr:glycosyltransferase family 2 protein [Candidatus Thiodiazotropha sp. (ex Epidulcina cf. delphinae)]